MTPRQVDELTHAEYTAMVAYADRDIRAQARAARQARRRR